MLKQRSDRDSDVIYLTLENDVVTTDMAGHRRTAVVAARTLGRPFAVVTDLTDCSHISASAAKELSETISHLVPFGLDRELRVINEETPDSVVEALERGTAEFDVEVTTVPSVDEAERKLAAVEKAPC